jgi:hypothetical protein
MAGSCSSGISYQSGATLSDAMLQKSEAALKKALATDLWNFYQARSVKGRLRDTGVESALPRRTWLFAAAVGAAVVGVRN